MDKIKLPTAYQYYVYKHVDPETGELLYVGKGSGQRAWMCSGSKDITHYGHRSFKHTTHLRDLIRKGFVPSDWVVIVRKGMDNQSAIDLEKSLISTDNPKFNGVFGLKICKMDSKLLTLCRSLREKGKSYFSIGKQVGVSTMSVYRGLNGITKNAGLA